jgi:poly(3-hydroxybutyrate) depolymerase
MPDQHSRRSILISSSIACLIALALIVIPARAQDAGQVLGLSVGYRTLKNSVPLSAEKKKEIEAIEAQARQASNEGKYGDALRYYHQAMTLLRGQTWTPTRALGLALQLKSEQLVFDPGDAVRLKLTQSFALVEPVEGKLAGKLVIARPQSNPPQEIAELRKLGEVAPDFTATPLALEARLPDLGDGNYQLIVTLAPSTGEPVVKTTTIRIARGFNARATALKTRATELAAKLEKENRADLRRALAPVEYTTVFISRVNNGDFPLQRADLDGELATSEALLAQIAKGENPLKARRGDLHWAYLSTVDKSLQPYRLFVPAAYDAKKKYPLVVALHGMGGDENSFFAGYENGVIKREAEARGYLVVCPKGRAPTSMYLGSAEQDVLDVIAEMKREYSIDEDRIYLTGHSMGGYGTWSIAVNHPQMFAAIAPFAGGGTPMTFAKIKAIAHVPEIVVHGNADPTVSVDESRRMVKAAEAAGAKVKYIEVEGGNHSNIVVPHMKDIFDWFDAHRRQPKAE